MGGSSTKIEYKTLECNKYPIRQTPLTFNNLKYIRCAFLTQEQYKNNYHIPKNSLNITFDTSMDNIENSVNNNIQMVYNKLNEITPSPEPIKIIKPIFVAFSRKVEYDSSVFDDNKKKPIEVKNSKYCLAIKNYIENYLNKMNNPDLNNKYNSLPVNKYDFKGNVKVIIFFPFITTDYKYITNFKDILNSSTYFINLLSDTSFNGLPESNSFDEEKFRKSFSKSGYSQDFINKIINDIKQQDRTNFRYRDDLMVLCNEGGCLSDADGEDFNSLLPRISDNNGDNTNNALKMSPFLPNKCLAQTNRYKCGILSPTDNNKSPQELIKSKDVVDYLTDGLQKYIINEECVITKGTDKYNKEFCDNNADNNPNLQQTPIDIINNVVSVFLRNEKYSSDLNDGKKNHYSETYSINIIKELMFINNTYPGIPEVVFPIYLYTENSDYTTEAPWGTRLLTDDYVFNEGDEILPNVRKYSENNIYYIEMNSQGQIYVRTNASIYYYLNILPFEKPVSMSFTNTITVNFIEPITNYLRPRSVINIELILKDEKHRSPFSFYVNNDGKIRIFSNGFLDATNKAFADFIDNKIIEFEKYKNNLNYYNSKNFDANNNVIITNIIDKDTDPPIYLYNN